MKNAQIGLMLNAYLHVRTHLFRIPKNSVKDDSSIFPRIKGVLESLYNDRSKTL